MSDLVGNPEDRFSCVAAHLLPRVLVKTREAVIRPDMTEKLLTMTLTQI